MDDLGAQERAVLKAITANPFAGQQEIANALGLARSTVAAHIGQLVQKGRILGRAYVLPKTERITCFGGATLDRKYHGLGPLIPGTSNPVEGRQSFGGVARNVAENLARLGVETSLATIVGDDENGRSLVRHLRDLGIDTSQVMTTTARSTAEYAAILGPDSDLVLGIADMGIFDLLTAAHLERLWPHLASSAWVFADCNLPAEVLAGLITRKRGARFKLAVDTVSSPKAKRLPADLSGIDLLFLNRDEADAVLGEAAPPAADAPEKAAIALSARGAAQVVLTMGPQGVVVAGRGDAIRLPAVPAVSVDVTGAGDAMIAGTLFRVMAGEPARTAARVGALLAALTTETEASVHPELSPRFLDSVMPRIPTMELAEA